ncbi:hypothetical protein CORC01_03081 [Colletotrichum orchidophilum]|uniref:DUF7580 domain-containing protein n=1 Tax=Colletotrichum orchidophilum TaxID=1209926 RepID=A0A1G4BJH8_9PEZI|nr:uncharacterized protein CORC01_03081 [Colletotrichum orchidophilum]OHF01591.1 hypothetical protein CORC01_03081 [Colletotrichum orchidophilum]
MAELALGVVGVVPIVGFVLQSYKAISKTFRDFRHCSTVVKRTRIILTYQERIFKNECQLLLQRAHRGDDAVDEMLDDPDHPEWMNVDLDRNITVWLGSNREAYLCTVEACSEALEGLREQCKEFEAVYAQQKTGERLKDTVRRLRKVQEGFKIAINEAEYCRVIANLKESTEALILLRTQILDLEKGGTAIRVKSRPPPPNEWASVQKTRRASQALHEALSEAWNCGQAVHERHFVKLFTESELICNEIQLSLAFASQDNAHETGFSTLVELVVRSQALEHPKLPSIRLPTGKDVLRSSNRVIEVDTDLPRTDPQSHISYDLRSTKDFCWELTQRAQPLPQKAATVCIGHLDITTDPGYRYSFFPRLHDIACCNQAVSLSQMLNSSTWDSVSIVTKLKLARALVLAILRFHSTPWLNDVWRLQDLSIFSRSQDDLSETLGTLHVGVGLAQKDTRRQVADSTDEIQVAANHQTAGADYDQLLYGVDNLSLHSLGVALLQIDRWQSLEIETPDDIVGVRRMSRCRFSLGPQYGEITRKCLRCDFGHGYDLTKPELQEAVYNNTIGVLEEMIGVLDFGEENEESF